MKNAGEGRQCALLLLLVQWMTKKRRMGISLIGLLFASWIFLSAIEALSSSGDSGLHRKPIPMNTSDESSIRVGHLGNSIQYYNDCPRLLEHMLKQRYQQVHQDSCLRGGATIVSLFNKGNGMAKKFATPNTKLPDGTYDIGKPTVKDLITDGTSWDFLIINDHTQSPVREESRVESLEFLAEKYLPLLEEASKANGKEAVVVFLMTVAYRRPVKNSEDLGSFD